MPIQAVYPNPPGPTPTGPYEYLAVPFKAGGINGGIRPDQFIPLTTLNTFFVESFFGSLSVPADRIDLIDRTRIYRILLQYMWRFPYDRNGSYVTLPGHLDPNTWFRFSVNYPAPNILAVNEWMPCSL